MNADAPVLIGSPPSSGSTLLSVMLDAHPDIACGPELCILGHPLLYRDFDLFRRLAIGIYVSGGFAARDPFRNVSAGLSPYAFAYDDNFSFYGFDKDQIVEIFRRHSTLRDFLADLFGSYLDAEGKTVLAEKSPPNLYAIPEFLDAFPAGKAVCLIRDPIDQIWSLKRRGFTFARALSIWLVETAICLAHSELKRVKLIRFEELVLNSRTVCTELVNFLNVAPAVDEMLNYVARSRRVSEDSSIGLPSWSHNPREAVSKDSIGRGVENLAPEELHALHNAVLTNIPPGLSIRAGDTAMQIAQRSGYRIPPCPSLDKPSVLAFFASEGLLESGHPANAKNFQERLVYCAP
jgi:hypothetical protein